MATAAAVAAATASPGDYPESPMDADDAVYPCKGCGQILEEGKAFELAGLRWHIDCFRCSGCRTLLDSNASLLLLGDGSLLCNDCTYNCANCGAKVENLVILTGDQAFCVGCFQCRNCKAVIDDGKYARTSQGVVCMNCHSALTARRRKRPKGSKTSSSKEKALPSLPPGVGSSLDIPFEVENATDFTSDSSTPQHRSPRESAQKYQRDRSPLAEEVPRGGPTLPSSTYNDPKASSNTIDLDDEIEGFLPMVLDPTPYTAPPRNLPPIPRKQLPSASSAEPSPSIPKENQAPREYFPDTSRPYANLPARGASRADTEDGSLSDREHLTKPGEHILSQDKNRSRKRDISAGGSSSTVPVVASPDITRQQEKKTTQRPDLKPYSHSKEDSKVSDTSTARGGELRATPRMGANSPAGPVGRDGKPSGSPLSLASTESSPNPFDDPKRRELPHPVSSSRNADHGLPQRGDSLATAAAAASATAAGTSRSTESATLDLSSFQIQTPPPHNHAPTSVSSGMSSFVDAQSVIAQTPGSEAPPTRDGNDVIPPPPRSASRPTASGPNKPTSHDNFTAPRAPPAPPAPPAIQMHRNNASISTMQSEDPRASLEGPLSPSLLGPAFLKFDGGFSMEDEMGRIMRGEKRESGEEKPQSVLRRVSNAVKHGRSFSERSISYANKGSPLNSSVDISSPNSVATPTITSPSTGVDAVDSLRASLRRAQTHIASLEAEKMALEEKLNGSSDIKAVNTELREKRSTMAILDTQREMVVRELEVMTNHLNKAKDSRQPLDLGSLKTNILKDFAESLQKLKDTMSGQIEDLMHKRNELTEEIGSLIQMKDKGFQEYESLSSKNTQLVQHNNELLRNIQGVYQDNRSATIGTPTSTTTSGLGIYPAGAKSDASSDTRNISLAHTDSMPQYDGEIEAATVLTVPQVVNIRKAAAPKKFNWRRGGEKMAKNVTKGIKGAFVGDKPTTTTSVNGQQYSIGLPYGATQQTGGPTEFGPGGVGTTLNGSNGNASANKQANASDDGKAGFGFFGGKNGNAGPGGLARSGTGLGHLKNNSGTNLALNATSNGPSTPVSAADGKVLFGSELSARCAFEGRPIPHLVSICIAQVEARGLEVEGIYRKSGGAGQVKQIQQAFERDYLACAPLLADPDTDIHSVTSALKQYFRKLPTPLITYDVYDRLLEAAQIPASTAPPPSSSSTTTTPSAALTKETSDAASTTSSDSSASSEAESTFDPNAASISALRAAVQALPSAHRQVLALLLQHLATVQRHDSTNLMTALNLAVVFAPTIMRPRSIEREMTDMAAQRQAIMRMVEWQGRVFADE